MKKVIIALLILISFNAKASGKIEKKDTIFVIDPVKIDSERVAVKAGYDKVKRNPYVGCNIYVTLYDYRMNKIISYDQYIPVWVTDVPGYIEYKLNLQLENYD